MQKLIIKIHLVIYIKYTTKMSISTAVMPDYRVEEVDPLVEESKDDTGVKLVSVESPYNALTPWNHYRNVQYAILANKHAASLGEVTWTPHICNTQFVKYGFNGYIGDTYGDVLNSVTGMDKYAIGREKTLEVTHKIRATKVDKVVCYIDFGISSGIQGAIDVANENGVEVEYRHLPKDLMKEVFCQSFSSTVLPTLKFVAMKGLMVYGLYKMFTVTREVNLGDKITEVKGFFSRLRERFT